MTTQDVETARHSNQQWLEDCSIRLLCVLALDRFGDFTSDQVGICAATQQTCVYALVSSITEYLALQECMQMSHLSGVHNR